MSRWVRVISKAAWAARASAATSGMLVLRLAGDVRALDRVALGVPAGQPLVEDAVIAPAHGVEDVAGPTGQRVRAGSVEDDEPRLRDLLGRARLDHPERHRAPAL